MNKTIIEIRPAKNGHIVTITQCWDVENGTTEHSQELVCQERYDESEHIQMCADVLSEIADEICPSTSRYSPERIYIRVEPGDKYED